jgi:hypothetical protein
LVNQKNRDWPKQNKEGLPSGPAAKSGIEVNIPPREVRTMEGAVAVAKEKSFLASLPAAIWLLSGAIMVLASLVFQFGVAEPKR